MTAEEIIQKAKQTYPCNYEYKGNLEEKKIEKKNLGDNLRIKVHLLKVRE